MPNFSRLLVTALTLRTVRERREQQQTHTQTFLRFFLWRGGGALLGFTWALLAVEPMSLWTKTPTAFKKMLLLLVSSVLSLTDSLPLSPEDDANCKLTLTLSLSLSPPTDGTLSFQLLARPFPLLPHYLFTTGLPVLPPFVPSPGHCMMEECKLFLHHFSLFISWFLSPSHSFLVSRLLVYLHLIQVQCLVSLCISLTF